MELRTRYLLNTATQTNSRVGAWLLLLGSFLALIPAMHASVIATQLLVIGALAIAAMAGIFLAVSRSPQKGKVTSEGEKIWFDQLWIQRSDVIGGYWSPGSGRRGSGVVLLGKDEREIAWVAVEDHAAGNRFLDHLEIGPSKRTVRFEAATTTILPAYIHVGVDGVSFGTRRQAGFVKWADVHRVRKSKRGAELELKNGGTFELPLALRSVRGEEARFTQTALLSVAREALEASRKESAPDVSVQIARNGRSHDEWVRALVNRDGSFRQAPVRVEDLWRVVESPNADITARAGAAAMLAQEASDEDRSRLRIAADICAEPRLRVVLDRAAAGDEAVLAALEYVEAEELPAPARTMKSD